MNSEITQAGLLARLRIVMGDEKPYPWAKRLGITQATFNRIWKEGVFPKGETLLLISEKTGYSIDWLVTGEGSMKRGEGGELPDGYVQVPRYAIAAAAGPGALVHSEQIVDHLAFKADWLKQQLGLNPAQAAVISVIGDSMEPYLYEGDLILIDLAITTIADDAIYVLQVGGNLKVKRIQTKSDGTVIVKSDNQHYEPEVFRGESVDLLRVVGRMVRRLVR